MLLTSSALHSQCNYIYVYIFLSLHLLRLLEHNLTLKLVEMRMFCFRSEAFDTAELTTDALLLPSAAE